MMDIIHDGVGRWRCDFSRTGRHREEPTLGETDSGSDETVLSAFDFPTSWTLTMQLLHL